NDALERAVIEWMVLDMNCQPLLPRIEARPLRDRPALQDAVELQPEIVMKPACRVLLDHKGESLARRRGARRLRCLPEIAFPSVFLERHTRQPGVVSRSDKYCSVAGHINEVRPGFDAKPLTFKMG